MTFETSTGRTYGLSFPTIDTSETSGGSNGGWYLLTPITPIKEDKNKGIAGYIDASNILDGDYMRRSNFFQMLVDNLVIEDFSSGTQSDHYSKSGNTTSITSVMDWFESGFYDNLVESQKLNIQDKVYYMDHTIINKSDNKLDNDNSMNTWGFSPNSACLPSAAWRELNLNHLDTSYANIGGIHNRREYHKFQNGIHGLAVDPNPNETVKPLNPPINLLVLTGEEAAKRVFGEDTSITSFDSRIVIDFKESNTNFSTYLNIRVDIGKCYWVYIRQFQAYNSTVGRLKLNL